MIDGTLARFAWHAGDMQQLQHLGGVGSGIRGHVTVHTVQGVGHLFADAPTSGSGAARWIKAHQKDYDSNPEFRAAADAAALLTQGGTQAIHAASLGAAGKEKDIPVEFWRKNLDKPLSIASNPLSAYKTYFKGQELDRTEGNGSADTVSLRAAGAALNKAIDTAPETMQPMYRGMQVPPFDYARSSLSKPVANPQYAALEKLKPGDTFRVDGITSFTVDKQVARDFSKGEARGQSNYLYNRRSEQARRASAVTLEVAPGARGLPVAALSPWRQKEVLTRGTFVVKSVDKVQYGAGRFSDFHVVLEAR